MSQADTEILPSSPTNFRHSETSVRTPRATRNPSVTIKDVARASGVSVGTVSNVVNGRHALVRAETRNRVLETARSMNFQPSAAARSLVQGRSRTIGVLFHTATGVIVVDPYASTVLQGILEGAAEMGYGVLIYPEPWRNPEQGARLLADRSAAGVLAIAPGVEVVADMAALGLPMALVSSCIDVHAPETEALFRNVEASVDVDNVAGARSAMEYLLGLGHRKIAHLVGDAHQRSATERASGWRTALAEAGIEVKSDYRIACDYGGDSGYAATERLLALSDPPTAIFAANDKLAFACLRAARDTGVNVPERLSVVGFDDLPSSALVTPALTTIRQPLGKIGRAAVEMLVAGLEACAAGVDSDAMDAMRACVLFPPELVIRGSSAAPPPPIPV